MTILIDNYDSFTYNLVQAIVGLGIEVKVFRNDKIDVEGIAALKPDSLVISPGPGNPDSAGISLAAVKAFAGKIPSWRMRLVLPCISDFAWTMRPPNACAIVW